MKTLYPRQKLLFLTSYRCFVILVLITTPLVILSCNDSSQNQNRTEATLTAELKVDNEQKLAIIIDIKKIANKSLSEVEKLLGKVERQESVKGYPCKNSNCNRAYFKSDKYEVIFKNRKADRITINETPNFTASDNAVQAIGLPLSAPSFANANNVARWNSIDGLHEVSFFTDYILVQVTQPE